METLRAGPFWSFGAALGFVLLVSGCRTQEPQRPHTLVVTLDYDFTKRHACTEKETKNCIKQFNVYELTNGQRLRLFSYPAPAGAHGPVKGITGTSGVLMLTAGDHIIGVTAAPADGPESYPEACSVIVKVPSSPH